MIANKMQIFDGDHILTYLDDTGEVMEQGISRIAFARLRICLADYGTDFVHFAE
jgi:hypothetical protein